MVMKTESGLSVTHTGMVTRQATLGDGIVFRLHGFFDYLGHVISFQKNSL